MVAFLSGTLVNVADKNKAIVFHPPTFLLGIILGAANFGSLYFLIAALNHAKLDSFLVFAVNNMSIVALSALLGTLLFKEKLYKINFAGIALAIASLYLLL